MKRSLHRARPALVLLASTLGLGAVTAGAQQKSAAPGPTAQGATCDVDQNKPGSLGIAVLAITRAQALPDTAAKFKALRDAAKRVNDDANAAKQNGVGTAFTLAQLYSLLSQDLRLATSATRADLGLGGATTQPADLYRTIDSLATVVQQAKPGCAAQLASIRQNAWVTPVNAALNAFNAQKADTAALLAERALTVYQESPLPYYVLASVAQQKGDAAGAARYWPRVAQYAASDTSQQGRDLHTAALQNIAANAIGAAQAAPAADKPARSREAADAIRAFLAANPNGPDAPRFQAALAQMLSSTGDKSAIGSVYADQLANPAKYDDLALTNAGVIASQAGNADDAAKLFAAALEKNAYQRDALNNLTATYYQQKKWAPMIPVAQRLVAVDPANGDNYLFLAYAYQGLAKAATAPAQKKAYTDSLIKYSGLADKQPIKVTFTEFTRGESRAVLGMKVDGLKPEAGAAAAPARGAARTSAAAGGAPKTYNVTVEFLDKTGAVIDTQNVSVGPIGAGDSKTARVESPKGGVVAFRYKIAG